MDSTSTQSFLEDSFEESPSFYDKALSRFSTWSTHCSEVDTDEASHMDIDEGLEEEATTPALSEGGESENSGSGLDTPQAITPRAHGTQEDETTQRYFVEKPKVVEEEYSAGTTAPLRIQRPNLKRYGKYIPSIAAPCTPPEDSRVAFEPYVQSPSANDAFDIVSWKLQALTVAQPKLALTPPTPFNELSSWGTTTPTRRGTQSPKEEGGAGEDKRWRRALYFAADNGQVDSSAGLRVLLQSMEELRS